MVEHRPVRHLSDPKRINYSNTVPGQAQSKNGGWLFVVAVIGLLIMIGKCSSSNNGSGPVTLAAEEVGNAQQALVSAVAEQKPPPVEAFSPAGARRGASRVSIAAREDLAGEMIYSQNCYDVVGRRFSWRKLDECGGFDIEASLALGDDPPVGAEKETAWFESEAAAGRYLKAATAAGLDTDVADQRLARLQAQVGAKHKPTVEASPMDTEPAGGEPNETTPADGEDNAVAAA